MSVSFWSSCRVMAETGSKLDTSLSPIKVSRVNRQQPQPSIGAKYVVQSRCPMGMCLVRRGATVVASRVVIDISIATGNTVKGRFIVDHQGEMENSKGGENKRKDTCDEGGKECEKCFHSDPWVFIEGLDGSRVEQDPDIAPCLVDACWDVQRAPRPSPKEKEEKELVVGLADTIRYPRAMVVETRGALVTHRAVVGERDSVWVVRAALASWDSHELDGFGEQCVVQTSVRRDVGWEKPRNGGFKSTAMEQRWWGWDR